MLSLLKKNYEIYPSLFANFKYAPTSMRVLWNSYSYDKKVEQALMLELLLQGFAIHTLANLHVTFGIIDGIPPEFPPVSHLKVALLGKKLIS